MNIPKFCIYISLIMFVLFGDYPAVIALVASFGAYFCETYFNVKNNFEQRLNAVEKKLNKEIFEHGLKFRKD